MKLWLATFSDLFVNLSAGWFAVVFIDQQTSEFNFPTLLSIIGKLLCGIMSLYLAKKLKEGT